MEVFWGYWRPRTHVINFVACRQTSLRMLWQLSLPADRFLDALAGCASTKCTSALAECQAQCCSGDPHLRANSPSLSSRPGVLVKQVSGLLATTRCMDRSMDGKHGWRWTKVCAKQALRKSCGTSLLQMWPCPSVSLRRERRASILCGVCRQHRLFQGTLLTTRPRCYLMNSPVQTAHGCIAVLRTAIHRGNVFSITRLLIFAPFERPSASRPKASLLPSDPVENGRNRPCAYGSRFQKAHLAHSFIG
mmetsp:Transcript_31760/g.79142  ORF Transcript_31760/g.79142 Transcript_31760/m.79142 type:complete len:248 (+) Transcript_31760:356-1099(+)